MAKPKYTDEERAAKEKERHRIYYQSNRDKIRAQPLCKICNAKKNDKTIDYRILPIVSPVGVQISGLSV